MAAHHSQFSATLFAHVRGQLTRSRVALLDALVAATLERFLARHAARELALAARNRLSLLVTAMAEYADERHARRTVGGRVAVVRDRMIARVLPGTGTIARWFLGATRNRWINDIGATLAE